MRYTKEQLLGAIFSWGLQNYVVILNEETGDTQLKGFIDGKKYTQYTLDYLNNGCLYYLKTMSHIYYEIY